MRVQHVALVIDDGPIPTLSNQWLACLREAGVTANFGVVGQHVQVHPELAQDAFKHGHELLCHGYAHHHPQGLRADELQHDVRLAAACIEQACGQAPRWFWPPYLERTPALERAVVLANMALFPLRHVVDSRDYDASVDAQTVAHNVESGVQDGCVILLHEWRAQSLEQLPTLLLRLQQRGVQFHSLTDLAKLFETLLRSES